MYKFVVFAALVAVTKAGYLGAPAAYAAAPVAAYHAPIAHAPVAYAAPYARQISYAAPAPVAYAAPIARPISYAAPAPLAYAAPVAKAVVHEEYDPNPQYSYGYDVQDALTGDSKSHAETRNGDVVQGSYSLTDPDGTRRTVEYVADPIHGFNAVVHKEPLAVKAIAAAPVAAYAAPIAKVAAHPIAAAPIAAYGAPIARYAASPYGAYGGYAGYGGYGKAFLG